MAAGPVPQPLKAGSMPVVEEEKGLVTAARLWAWSQLDPSLQPSVKLPC